MGEYGVKGKYDNFKYSKKKSLEIAEPKKGKAYIYCKTPVTNELKVTRDRNNKSWQRIFSNKDS